MRKTQIALTGLLVSLGGCSAMNQDQAQESNVLKEKLRQQEQTLSSRQQRIDALSSELEQSRQSSSSAAAVSMGDPLLPPGAKSGECYARVWVEPEYRTVSENYIAREASEKVTVQPAIYEWETTSVLVKEASERSIPVPAQYGFEEQTVKISDGQRSWHKTLSVTSPASKDATLAAAKRGGIDLDNAEVNSCYHEHYVQPQYDFVSERVLVSEASENVEASAPVFETVEQRVLVSEASSRLVTVPAVYETITEQVLDKPAHTVWKKGSGPVQRIDAATGEIMCLVEIPASYKTVNRRVLRSSATTKTVEIPAEYKMVDVRRKVSTGAEQRVAIPAVYKDIKKRVLAEEGSYVWHEIHDKSMEKSSRTGQQVCLTETPARYRTVKRKVVSQPASFRAEAIPAVYKDVKVRKLVAKAKEIRDVIPAIEKTVSTQELEKAGHMEWRSILCETNMTNDRLRQIQMALKDRGYEPGPIDGVIGRETIAAVNKFQQDKSLPVDRYLNIATLKALGVAAK